MYLYKTISLQPQGQILTILKAWVTTLFSQSRNIRRNYGSRTMLTDSGNIPVITFFHAPSDPHSTILLQALKILVNKKQKHWFLKIRFLRNMYVFGTQEIRPYNDVYGSFQL